MPSPRDRTFNPLPLLAALAAAAALALFFKTRGPAPAPPPEPVPAEATPTPSPTPSPTPESPPEPTPEPPPAGSTPPEPESEPPDRADTASEPPAPHEVNRPSDEELLGPLPAREGEEEVAAIPTLHEPIPFNVPPPPRVEVAGLAEQPNRWPSRVLLRKPVRFPVIINGQASGSVLVPAKTPVAIRRVFPDGRLEIGYHHSTAVVPASSTDFLLRVKAGGTPPPAQQRKQIVTFPDTPLNPGLSPSGTPSPSGREIPIR